MTEQDRALTVGAVAGALLYERTKGAHFDAEDLDRAIAVAKWSSERVHLFPKDAPTNKAFLEFAERVMAEKENPTLEAYKWAVDYLCNRVGRQIADAARWGIEARIKGEV